MGRQRRGFTPEYKDEAVKLVINTGRPAAVVARELGIQESTLGRWVNVFKAHQDGGNGVLSETERAELARLRKERVEAKIVWFHGASDEVSGSPRILARPARGRRDHQPQDGREGDAQARPARDLPAAVAHHDPA